VSVLTRKGSNGLTPVLQRDALVELCRALFEDGTKIRDTYLSSRVYSSTASDSNIVIEPVEKKNLETLGKRPGIYIEYKGTKLNTPSMQHGLLKDSPNRTHFIFYMQSAINVLCISSSASEAYSLASEVMTRLAENTSAICHEYDLDGFKVTGMSNATQTKEFKDHWIVGVQIQLRAKHISYRDRTDLPDRLTSSSNIA
jgi:hypothetical protein